MFEHDAMGISTSALHAMTPDQITILFGDVVDRLFCKMPHHRGILNSFEGINEHINVLRMNRAINATEIFSIGKDLGHEEFFFP